MRKMSKKLARTAVVLVAVALVLVVGLRLFFPAEKVRSLAVSKAGEKLGRKIVVADAGVSFAGGLGVRLGGVEIANPEGFAGAPLLTAEKIDLKLQILPLFRGEFRVHRLVLVRPRVDLVQHADGANNFTFASPQKSAAAGVRTGAGAAEEQAEVAVSFESLQIEDARLVFRDEKTGQGLEMAGLGLSAGLTNPRPGVFRSAGVLEVDSLVVAGEKPLPSLSGKLDYDLSVDSRRRTLELARGGLAIQGLPFDLEGSLTFRPDSLAGRGRVLAAGIAVTDLLAFLTPAQRAPLEAFTLAGEVSLEADLDYDRTRAVPLAYRGLLKAAGVRASRGDITGELRVQEISCRFQPDALELETRGGTFADQPLTLNLSVEDFADPRVKGAVSGDLDLAFAAPFLPAERKAVLAGRCRLDGSFSGRTAKPDAMDYQGRAVFQDVSYREPALPDALEKLDGTLTFSPDSVRVEKMEARFGAGDLSLTGTLVDHLPYFLPSEKDRRATLPKPRFTFALRSRRIDVDKLFPAAAPGGGVRSASAKTMPDTIRAESIPDLLAQGTIQADTLIYSRVPFTGITGKVRLKDRILECYDVTGGVYGGRASGKVAIDLKNPNDPGYGGDFQAVDIEADNFVSRFAGFGGVVFGKAGMTGSFKARGRDPETVKRTLTLDSRASLISGKVVTGDFVHSSLGSLADKVGQKLDRTQTLKDLTTLIKVTDGRVVLDQFKTKFGTLGDLSLGGSYGFAGDLEYKGAILLSKEQTARLYASGGLVGSIADLVGDKAERLSLPLAVGGTMTSPRLDLDYTALTDSLKSQLEGKVTDDLKGEVGKKLKGLFGK